MTKFFRLIVLVLTMAALAPMARATTPDVNLDNAVDVVDVQTTVNVVLATSMPQWTGQGDVNGDATVDVVDVQTLVNEILGLSTAPLSIPDPGPVLSRPVGLPWVRRVFALGGGGATKTFSLGPGAPAWLSVTSDGELRGTPPSVGQFAFILNVTTGGAPVLRPVSLTVSNQIPVVENEIVYVTAGATYSSAINGVLANDVDPDGHVLTATKIMDPLVGQMVLLTTGFFNYVIPANAEGVHGMAYEVSDGFGGVVRGSVKFIIIPANDTEVRAEDIVIPGMVQTGSFTRVTIAYRVPAGQTVTAVIAQIENTASIASLSPHTSGTLSPGTTLWSATLATTGLAAGVHKVIISASVNGGPEIVRTRRIVVYAGTPLRVGPGAHATVSAALQAAVVGQTILVDPAEYFVQNYHLVFLTPNQGMIGCPHGPTAARLLSGTSRALTAQSNSIYGFTITQSVYGAPQSEPAVRATGVNGHVTVVHCRFLGAPLSQTQNLAQAVIIDQSATANLLGCDFIDWWTPAIDNDSTGVLSNGAALTMRRSGLVTVEDCTFVRCRQVNAASYRTGGAIAVRGEVDTVRGTQLLMSRSVFMGCSIEGQGTYFGGALGVSWATATVTQCRFDGNSARYPSSVNPVQPHFENGLSFCSGGAVAAWRCGVINLYQCEFVNNYVSTIVAASSGSKTRSSGGSIACILNSSIVADDCLFEGSTVYYSPGEESRVRGSVALVQQASALRLVNCRVRDNGIAGPMTTASALFAVGGKDWLYATPSAVGARLSLENTLITSNRGSTTTGVVLAESPDYTATPSQVSVLLCTVADQSLAPPGASQSGAVFAGNYGSLSVRDSIIWTSTIPLVNWSGGGSTTVLHTVTGPTLGAGVTTAVNNLTSDPLFAPSGSWLLLPTSPAINAGTSLAQVSGLGPRSALDNLSPDLGQVDLGYHAPMPSAGVIPFTTTDAYTQGHLLGLHAAYSAPPPP